MAWDAIVVGLGGVGSAALHALARRGLHVLGLEARGIAHSQGSSHGRTRLWRRGYYEHVDYVPLVDAALEGWRALEAETETRLLEPVELLEIGPPEGELIPGIRRSAREYGVAIEELTTSALSRRYGGAVHLPQGMVALCEGHARLLWVESCIERAVIAAKLRGAIVQADATVQSFARDGAGFVVDTSAGKEYSNALVITAGPWTSQLLGSLGQKLVVRRKPVFWYRYPPPGVGLPALFVEGEDQRSFYAFPLPGEPLFKAAEHTGGESIEDPSQVSRIESVHDQPPVSEFLARFLPGLRAEPSGFHVCMYTMSSDGHFIVDRHPEFPHLAFTAGLSGHGFKFAPVLGDMLAALALGEKHATRPNIWRLR